ncbi:MAG: M15 family metallopeptidase [Deltaproteobacteria bacterium]|nr:M15 family metallopeptidase [Deltaproteobacteria bacterium]
MKILLATCACNCFPDAALAGTHTPHRPPGVIPGGDGSPQEAFGRRNFRVNGLGQIVLFPADYALLRSTSERLARVQLVAGHGNFALMNIEDAFAHARYDPSIGAFTRDEIRFMHKIFHQNARLYGFKGEKPLTAITDDIGGADFVRVPGTGNYLFTGTSIKTYHKMSSDVGKKLILTSGIRGIAKQFYLFFRKAVKTKGNLSIASRSLAPPGYSFHGVGDFDVGSIGLGSDNFTRHFTQTDVFKKIRKLDYVRLRYTESNRLGVRFEPWHIKVI